MPHGALGSGAALRTKIKRASTLYRSARGLARAIDRSVARSLQTLTENIGRGDRQYQRRFVLLRAQKVRRLEFEETECETQPMIPLAWFAAHERK